MAVNTRWTPPEGIASHGLQGIGGVLGMPDGDGKPLVASGRDTPDQDHSVTININIEGDGSGKAPGIASGVLGGLTGIHSADGPHKDGSNLGTVMGLSGPFGHVPQASSSEIASLISQLGKDDGREVVEAAPNRGRSDPLSRIANPSTPEQSFASALKGISEASSATRQLADAPDTESGQQASYDLQAD